MKETWISERRMIQLPGLTVDRHISAPNELEFPGCNHHLLCILLSDRNLQKITCIGEQKSEKLKPKEISGFVLPRCRGFGHGIVPMNR
ncbi:hypothetical protein [Nostoc sp.]|uniref:hypothetical protein n=1 Tax=Nostoc sp. TaxID=1180 RepID=UPI002FF51977